MRNARCIPATQEWIVFKTVSTLSAIAMLAALAGSPTRAAARDVYDRHLNLVNRSGEAITSFFASNCDDPSWRWDLLGDDIVHPGYYTQSIWTAAAATAGSISAPCWRTAGTSPATTSMCARCIPTSSSSHAARWPRGAGPRRRLHSATGVATQPWRIARRASHVLRAACPVSDGTIRHVIAMCAVRRVEQREARIPPSCLPRQRTSSPSAFSTSV